MNTTTSHQTIDAHGGVRVHCQHSDDVCATKSGINAKAACAKQAERMAHDIYGEDARISWSRGQAVAYPNAQACFLGMREAYANASNPYLDAIRAAKGRTQ